MNKKGFTLVELLAVIIILGTILVIAVPRFTGVADASRKKTLEISAKSFSSELKKAYVQDNFEISEAGKTFTIEGNSFLGDSLDVTGELPDTGKLYVDPEGNVALTLTKGNYCAVMPLNGEVEVFEDLLMCELGFSQITLIGDNPLYLRQNTVYVPTSYVEPGFVAIDEYGGNRPDKVTVTSDIDINTVGTYTVTYVLKSNLGDTIDTETRTVIVYDGIPPIVTTAVATSNNTINNKYALKGNTVTLNLTFTKSVSDPSVTIG